jgi:hypothetical protein
MGSGLAWLSVQLVSAKGIRQQGPGDLGCPLEKPGRQTGRHPHHRRECFECFEGFERCECFKLNTRDTSLPGLLADEPTVRHSAMALRSSLVAALIGVSIVVGRSQNIKTGPSWVGSRISAEIVTP